MRLLARDRGALLLLFLAPLVVISAAGFSLSSLYQNSSHLLPVVDRDRGKISEKLVAALAETAGIEVTLVGSDEARTLVAESPRVGAALLVPEGFSEALRNGEPAKLVLWTDPVKHLEVLKVRAAVERARAGLVTARVAARIAVIQVLTHGGDVDFESLSEDSASLAERIAEGTVSLEESNVFGGPTEFNTFDQNVPGFSVTFLLLGMLFGVGLGLLDEREWGMVYRLSASPVPPAALLAGKMLSRFTTGVLQMAILFLFGRVAFGISLGPSIPALGLTILGISFASAAFGFLAATLARSRDAMLPIGTMAVVAMAAIGGCWWPITIEPTWLQKTAHLFPTAWAMGAFNDLMLRQRELGAVLPNIAALLGFGLLYLALGARLYESRRSA
ncbi:MAG TPA: ABC transporter permease [Vicinamibacteria bacterium]|nr:ABC transporter permease [Vicinamibacteria bacterium]